MVFASIQLELTL